MVWAEAGRDGGGDMDGGERLRPWWGAALRHGNGREKRGERRRELTAIAQSRTAGAGGTGAVVIYRTGGREGEDGRVCYLVGRSADSPADCKYLCDLLNGLYNGKGGGKAGFAQGSGRLLPDWQETAEALRRML